VTDCIAHGSLVFFGVGHKRHGCEMLSLVLEATLPAAMTLAAVYDSC
jgi:hypothetical protein